MNGHGFTRRAILKSGWSVTTLALSDVVDGATSQSSGMVDGRAGQSQASIALVRPGERDAISDVAHTHMAKFKIPGLSVAVAKDGAIVYAEGFGVVSQRSGAPAGLSGAGLLGKDVTPASLFRIASVSKPITSVGIFTLVEQGRLSLTDRVFGEHGILSEYRLPANGQFIGEITIDHLLTHTLGGWDYLKNDPMFLHVLHDMDHRQLIAWTLKNLPLSQQPGTSYAYSNFGYCLLGRVIEKITGQSYADYVRRSVLRPSQAEGMRIGGSRLRDRAEGEVVYHRQDGDFDPYAMNVARMDSNGGWLASPADLVRFVIGLDGTARSAAILKPETVAGMTKPSDVNPGYARGWFIYGHNQLWHAGSLAGTSAAVMHTPSGLCWAALANSRDRHSASVGGLYKAVWEMVRGVEAWGYS
jgi:CubicO group peptidase (beta-lactamase class C family)